MSLDHLLRGIETKLSEQSGLLELAQAWLERTEGIIVKGVQWDAGRYITELQKIPLWEKVKANLSIFPKAIRSRFQTLEDQGQEAHLLLHFPQLTHTLEYFLDNPLYSDGNPAQGHMASPFSFRAVLSSYAAQEQEGKPIRRGDCIKVYYTLQGGHVTEDFILDALGLQNRWRSYQATKRLPDKIVTLISRTLETFLEKPLYSEGNPQHGPVASPLPLRAVLLSFVSSEKTMKPGKGDCRTVYTALRRGYFSDELVLESAGLQHRWQSYQKSKELPPSIANRIRKTVEKFLEHPLYADGSNRYGMLSFPLSLRTVLCSYVSGEGRLKSGRGNCYNIYEEIINQNLSEDFLLESVHLTYCWQAYQETRKLPETIAGLVRRTLEDFLNNPLYSEGNGRHGPRTFPLPLRAVLNSYVSKEKRLRPARGDCEAIYRAIVQDYVSEDFLLGSIGLQQDWKTYQQSNATNPYRRAA